MVKTVTAVKARQNLGELLNRVAIANEEIIIQRAGKQVAKLVGCEEKIVVDGGRLDFRTSAGLGQDLWATIDVDEYLQVERKG
jgi:prevent-host-death family protein